MVLISLTPIWRGADLQKADLTGADLSNADLRGAMLFAADLRGADFRGAKLIDNRDAEAIPHKETRMTGARYNQFTSWPDGFDPQEHGLYRLNTT